MGGGLVIDRHVLTGRSPRSSQLLAPAVVGVIALAGYVLTLMPGMAFGDWGEMQTIPHVLGVAHPTGYPTYIVVAWLAQLVPLGSIAFRANLLSAVLVSGALAVVVTILVRLGTRPIIAVAVAIGLGAVPTVWAAATVAEVNPLHLLFAAALIHRALMWEEGRSPRDLVIGALVAGLALGNHLLTLIVAPLVGSFALWVGRREVVARPRILVPAIAVGLLGLSVYLYIPIAASGPSPLRYNHPVTLDGILWLVSGTQFRDQFGFLSTSGLREFTDSLSALWRLLAARATPVAPILGLVGLAVLIRRRPAFGLMGLAILVANLYVWATYHRLEHYLLVPCLMLAIGNGVALESAARLFSSRASWARGFDIGRLVGTTALTLALAFAVTGWQMSDRSSDRSAEVFADTVLGALPEHAAILTPWEASTPLWHALYVLGRRPDVLIVDDTDIVYEGWVTRDRRIASLICERPVFILRLREPEIQATREKFRLTPFLTVRVARGGPSATVTRPVYRVEPLDPSDCRRPSSRGRSLRSRSSAGSASP